MGATENHTIQLSQVSSGIPVVEGIQTLISSKYAHLFLAVIVHGSVATDEIIRYSDFDGLLIVKDNYLESPELKRFITESMEIILRFDPLQHHGWFQISESQLKSYPENYLPIEILRHSKLLFPHVDNPLVLELSINQNVDYTAGLKSSIQVFRKRESANWKPVNMYQLKSFLSEVMLLPSVFYAHKTGNAIFKRESFNASQDWFSKEEWHVIEIASTVREQWSYSLNPIQRIIMERPERFFRKLTEKFVAPRIPKSFVKQLDGSFFRSLEKFLDKLESTIM